MIYITDDGVIRSGEQIEAALEACRRLELAYAKASEDNGGGSSVDWSEIDAARECSMLALTDAENLEIVDKARVANDFEPEDTYEFCHPEDSEGGTCD